MPHQHDTGQPHSASSQHPVPASNGADLAERMSAIARQLRHEHQPIETTLEAITAAAVDAVPAAADAGISFITDNARVEARAPTSPRPATLDQLQDQLDQGPCLRALRAEDTVHIPDMGSEARWPRFAAAAGDHGVGAMFSLRLYVSTDNKLGALNLYADTPHAFDDESMTIARIFAVHAAIALAAAERETHLETALRGRDRISQAKGILMERYKLTPDQAFTLLARASSSTNRKLRDVADEIATTGDIPT